MTTSTAASVSDGREQQTLVFLPGGRVAVQGGFAPTTGVRRGGGWGVGVAVAGDRDLWPASVSAGLQALRALRC